MDIFITTDNIKIKDYLVFENEDYDKCFICNGCNKDLKMVNYKLLPCKKHHNGCEDCWIKSINNNNGRCLNDSCDSVTLDFNSMPESTNEMFIKIFNNLKIYCPYSNKGKSIRSSNSRTNNSIGGTNNSIGNNENSYEIMSPDSNETSCNQIITVGQLDSHLKECPSLKCKYCKSIEHTNECPKKQVLCKYCSIKCEKDKLDIHYTDCPNFEIRCTIPGCFQLFKRNEFNLHYEEYSHSPGYATEINNQGSLINRLKNQYKDQGDEIIWLKNENSKLKDRCCILESIIRKIQIDYSNRFQEFENEIIKLKQNNPNSSNNSIVKYNKKQKIEPQIKEIDNNEMIIIPDANIRIYKNEKEKIIGTWVVKEFNTKKANKGKMNTRFEINSISFSFRIYHKGVNENSEKIAIELIEDEDKCKFDYSFIIKNYNNSNLDIQLSSGESKLIEDVIELKDLTKANGWLVGGSLYIDFEITLLDK